MTKCHASLTPLFPLASIPTTPAPLYRNLAHESQQRAPIRRYRKENKGAQDDHGNDRESRRLQLRTFLSWPQTRAPLWTLACRKHALPPSFSHYCGNGRPRRRLFCPCISRMWAGGRILYSPCPLRNILKMK